MNKKRLLFIAASSTFSLALSVLILTSKEATMFSTNAQNSSYGISFSQTKNKFFDETGSTAYSGETTLKTNLGSDVDFSYSNVMGLNNTWHVFKTGGYFYNTDPINGLESINLTFKNDGKTFKLYWSYSNVFNNTQVYSGTSSQSSSTSFNFNGDLPTYIKFENTSDSNLNVSGVDLSFSCSEKTFTTSVVSEDESKGTVSGSGSYVYGQTITLTASPKTGFAFGGWYENSELVSTEEVYQFSADGSNHSFVGKFVTTYRLYIYSEDENRGTVIFDYYCGVGMNATVVANPKRGYSFDFWYDEDLNEISHDASYTFVMPSHDVTLYAGFYEGYDISVFSKCESELSFNGAGRYLVDSEVNLKVGLIYHRGTFIGWYDGDELVSTAMDYTFTCEKPLNLEAKWHNLVISSNSVTGYNTSSSHVYVPEGISSIGYTAFQNCTWLQSIDLPSTLTKIWTAAFNGCSNLSSIELPYGLTTIEDNVFMNCSSITSMNIPDSVTSINYQTFCYCYGLTSVVISYNLHSIESGLFNYCSSLTDIRYNGTINMWNSLLKNGTWKAGVPATQVVCSDGVVSI